CSTDRTTRVWDATTGEELLKLGGLGMVSATFHPDGRRLLTANSWSRSTDTDFSLRLWDATSGRELRTFVGNVVEPTGLGFTPAGRRIVSCAWDATVRVWETDTGRLLRTLGEERQGRDAPPTSDGSAGALWLTVHPDGRHVACCYQPTDVVKVWDIETGQVLWTSPGVGGYNALSYSPDGRFLAVSQPASPPSTEVLDARSGRLVTSVAGMTPVFLGNGRRVVTTLTNSVKVWDTSDGRLLLALRGPGETYLYKGAS